MRRAVIFNDEPKLSVQRKTMFLGKCDLFLLCTLLKLAIASWKFHFITRNDES